MACLISEEVAAYLAGTLPEARQVALADHVDQCESCRRVIEAHQQEAALAGDLRDAFETVSSPSTVPGIVTDAGDTGLVADSIEGYEILLEIHRGGQGVVYKAVQKATKRTVALKVLLQGPYASPRQRHRFEREIDLVANLQHPNIVTIYDSGVTRGRHFFAMEYIRGQPLNAYLSDKNLGIDETLRLFQKICSAVNYAHQRGVIHRDLKPANIRIGAGGEALGRSDRRGGLDTCWAIEVCQFSLV